MLWGEGIAKDLTKDMIWDCCQYNGPGNRKRTRIAHSNNIQWKPRPLCDPKTCGQCVDGKHLVTAQRGPTRGNDKQLDRCSLDTLHALARELTEEILAVCQNHMWQVI